MPKGTRRHLLLTCLVAVWTVLACSPCGWLTGSGITLPDRPVAITEEAAQRFEDKLQGAWEGLGENQFRLQFTDEEVTSYINVKLQAASALPVAGPRIWLTRGKIYVSGMLDTGDLPLRGQAVIVASAHVVDEKVLISIEQARVGQVPIPNMLLSSLEDTVNTALSQAQFDVKIVHLEVLEGEAILVAAPR